MEYTKHFTLDRQARNDLIHEIGLGTEIKVFKVDRGHPNGPELHTVTSTALILIFNARTKKLVTILIARPQQIRRLYENSGLAAPQELLDLALAHTKKGYNRR